MQRGPNIYFSHRLPALTVCHSRRECASVTGGRKHLCAKLSIYYLNFNYLSIIYLLSIYYLSTIYLSTIYLCLQMV